MQHCNQCFHQCWGRDECDEDFTISSKAYRRFGRSLEAIYKTFHGIPKVKWNPWLSVWERCFTQIGRNCKFSLWPLECQSTLTTGSVKGQDHSELQRAISALIFLWLRRLIADCDTTARSPLHLLLTALWQLNTQVRVLTLGPFFFFFDWVARPG